MHSQSLGPNSIRRPHPPRQTSFATLGAHQSMHRFVRCAPFAIAHPELKRDRAPTPANLSDCAPLAKMEWHDYP